MRKLVLLTAAVLAAVFLFLAATMPPAPRPAPGAADADLLARTIAGAYHVHTTISDGAADRRTVAAAAARAGLAFVIFTDHGDGTRVPDPPAYVEGVLCLDGVEISTDQGHYVAIETRPSPYPLGGAASAVVEDVRRLGGFGFAAHPDSPKEALRWTDWSSPVDGIEWLNADSEWRDERWSTLLRTPADYVFRPGPALARLLDRPQPTLSRWDSMSAARPLVAIAAHDAHGGVGRGRDEDSESRLAMPVPSYEASFRTFAVRAVLPQRPSGEAATDARLLLDAIRAGRIFTAVDALATPAWLDFRSVGSGTTAQMGDVLPYEPHVRLSAAAPLVEGSRLVLLCNGREVADSSSGQLEWSPATPGACRVEVHLASAPGDPPIPWIVGNPIHLLPTVPEPIGFETLLETVPLADARWVVESDPGSQGELRPEPGGFQLEYSLRPGERASQYVAAATRLGPGLVGFGRLVFTAESEVPMRLSVQLRLEGEERWVRSVYLSDEARRITVPFTAFLATADAAPGTSLDPGRATSLLFVIDLTNARPASAGRIRITDIALARQPD